MENTELNNFIQQLNTYNIEINKVVEHENKYIIVLNHSTLNVDLINKCQLLFNESKTIGIDFSISTSKLVIKTDIITN